MPISPYFDNRIDKVMMRETAMSKVRSDAAKSAVKYDQNHGQVPPDSWSNASRFCKLALRAGENYTANNTASCAALAGTSIFSQRRAPTLTAK